MTAPAETFVPGFADFASIRAGDTASLTKEIMAKDVERFATMSGDRNPLHMDETFAQGTSFQKRVVHGMLVASYVSTLIGMQLPGPGALWMQQSFRWPAPVFIGDLITVTAKVIQKSEGTRMVSLGMEAVNQEGTVVLQGEGKVVLLERSKETGDVPLSERVALVTGSSRGIGAAIATALSAAGVKVAVNYSRDSAEAARVCEDIGAAGGTAIPVQADIRDPEAIAGGLATIERAFGRSVDVLVNNATSAFAPRPVRELTWPQIQALMDVHVKGSFHCIQAVLPGMMERKSGRIINIGLALSSAGGGANWSALQMAKASLGALTRSLAAEVGPHGIRVNTVSPGLTETTSLAAIPERLRKIQAMQTPLRRLCRPEDIARVVVFLAGDGGEFITGSDVPVAGGMGI